MFLITFLRIAITLTFLILAAGGPYALLLLRRFIRRYTVAHEALKTDHEALKARVTTLESARGLARGESRGESL